MKLIAYVPGGQEIDIRPALRERDWMDASPQRFAYRCLPLTVANTFGWEILCRSPFKAIWAGETEPASISIETSGETVPPATSHFGSGLLTFHVPCVFRTEPGYDLMVQGPINRPKDAIAPLSAVVEADWAPYSFTMNWIFTQPEVQIEFERGEPFCHIFPIRRGELETVEPTIVPMTADPHLREQHQTWSDSRKAFNQDLKDPGSQARASKWQKNYYRGLDAFGERVIEDHHTRVHLKQFKRTG